MNFAEGEETVTVAAVFNERRLQGRLHSGNLGEVDIASQLLPLGRLEIELFEPISASDYNARFFRVDGIHQHSLGWHKV
ncbi:hypothetical protein GCM10011321_10070 [Youhaiella tibetensis]|nr:hypothetical protein GCM10011321_10070 [Youhaiella tibetensis]